MCTAAFHTLYVQVHILLVVGKWRRREVCYDLNFVCRAFHIGLFAAGLFSCRVYVNCTDTRVSFPSFGGFSLLFVGTRGSTGIRNSRGRIFELNSFHLGQDCPQSFLNLTPSIWVKCPLFLMLSFHLGQVLGMLSSILILPFGGVSSGASLSFGWSCWFKSVGLMCIKLAPFWRVQRENPHGTPFQT